MSSTIATDGVQALKELAKRVRRVEREQRTIQSSDLLGPGIAAYAGQVDDWNSNAATFNGFFWSIGDNNGPEVGTWMGQVICSKGPALGVKHGVQIVWAIDDVLSTRQFTRTFSTIHGSDSMYFGDWRSWATDSGYVGAGDISPDYTAQWQDQIDDLDLALATKSEVLHYFEQTTEPAGPHPIGSVWLDTDDSSRINFWDGDSWQSGRDGLIAAAAAAAAAAQTTADTAVDAAADAANDAADAQTDADTANAGLATHIADHANPHAVTKTQVGLSNADNTADSAKPVSILQAAANALRLALAGGTMDDGAVINAGTTTGLQIAGSIAQKLGFFAVTPVVQPTATTELSALLSSLGLRAVGNFMPITTGGAVAMTGTVRYAYTITATNLTLGASNNDVEVTASGVTVTLPTAVSTAGREYTIINVSTGSVTIQGNGAQVIGNTAGAANTYALAAGASVTVVSNGTLWRTK